MANYYPLAEVILHRIRADVCMCVCPEAYEQDGSKGIHQRIIKPSSVAHEERVILIDFQGQRSRSLLTKILVKKIEGTAFIRDSSNFPQMLTMERG